MYIGERWGISIGVSSVHVPYARFINSNDRSE